MEASFTLNVDAELAASILFHVCEMSGVTAQLSGDGPFVILATVSAPFDATRLDDVERVIAYDTTDYVRS